MLHILICGLLQHHTKFILLILSTLHLFSDSHQVHERKLFMDEIELMKRVSCSGNPHVLKMLACVTTTFPMMLILQYVSHGSLKDYLRVMKNVGVRNNCNKQISFEAAIERSYNANLQRQDILNLIERDI